MLLEKVEHIKSFLTKNYLIESNQSLNNFITSKPIILKLGGFITSTNNRIKCPETKQCLVTVRSITSINNITKTVLFQKGFYLKECGVFNRLYSEYKDALQTKFYNHPELFSLSSKLNRSFLLEFDRTKQPLNYINYLKLMSLVLIFSFNKSAYDLNIYNIDINVINVTNYEPFLGVNSSVLVYVHANEFFLKINYSINIKDFNNSDYNVEELVYQEYNTIIGNVYIRYENVIRNPSIYMDEIRGGTKCIHYYKYN